MTKQPTPALKEHLEKVAEQAAKDLADATRELFNVLQGGRGSILEHRRMIQTIKKEFPELYRKLIKIMSAQQALDTAEFYVKHPDRY